MHRNELKINAQRSNQDLKYLWFFLIRYVLLELQKNIPTLTLIGKSYEKNKNAHLKRHLEAFFIRLNELGGYQVNPIDVNFHLQKSLDIFDKNSADKIWFQKEIGVESALPHAN